MEKKIYLCYQLRMNKNNTILEKNKKSFQQLSRTPYII